MLVDVHSHIFPAVHGQVGAGPTRGLGYGRIAIGEQSRQLMPPLNAQTIHTVEMLLANLDWAGVDKAVLLQGSYYGECNEYVRAAVTRHPDRLAAAAYLDPWGADPRRSFAELFETPGFRIVKLEFSEESGLWGLHPGARLDQSELDWLWDEMQRRGLTLTLDLGRVGCPSYQTGAVRAVAEAHPDLKIVVAHLGQPSPAAESDPGLWSTWQEQIDLGRLPNVWFDSAALPIYLPQEAYPYPSAARYLRLAIERVGPAKVMWGSDQPGLLAVATYPQLARLAREHSAFLSPHEQELFLSENARLVYGV